MPISTAAAGSDLPPHERLITVRDALAYAAGIGDTCESVFDDARGGGIAAPPSYCVSLEWPVVSNGRGRHLLGGEADGGRQIAFRVLNAEGEEAVSQGLAVVA